jgi:hypothetical protein|tara:strand:- start:399 stop:566 length:168 start_codon:yes stop_codon:yes gene_type:complete
LFDDLYAGDIELDYRQMVEPQVGIRDLLQGAFAGRQKIAKANEWQEWLKAAKFHI